MGTSGLTNSEFFKYFNNVDISWECDKCIMKTNNFFPFNDLDDDTWLKFNEVDVCNNKLSDDVNTFSSTEIEEFASQCDSIQTRINLANGDDNDDFISSQVNSKYYDIKELNSLKIDLPSSFGLFHVNIASLNKHIADLKLILSLMKYKFDIIGISEHKILIDTLPSNNTDIPGYKDFIFIPTESTHGGTGFYIKDNLDHIDRKDLQISLPNEFESMFIEIQLKKKEFGCWFSI